MKAKKSLKGLHIEATGKSLHAGQQGIIAADYVNMLLILADNTNYPLAFTNTIGDGKYFQLDRRWFKEVTHAKN